MRYNPFMLRLTEIKLPLDHPLEAIAAAAVPRLRIAPDELVSCTIFRRAHAGGILPAGVDGIKIAEAVAQSLLAGS